MTKLTRSIQVAVVAAAVLAAVAATATGATDSRSAAPRNCAFQTRCLHRPMSLESVNH